jgi:hypothetical protein
LPKQQGWIGNKLTKEKIKEKREKSKTGKLSA